jgi:hypothetical protein
MGVADNNAVYGSNAIFTRQNLSFHVPAVANAQTALELWSHTPGFAFQILGLEVYCTAVTAICTIAGKIKTTVFMSPLTPVAAIHTEATILTTGVEYGDDDEVIYIYVTTDAGGDLTAASFQLTYRRRAQSIS